VFADCDRAQIWRIAKWGEVIEAHPGEVLVREDYTDYWFFVLLSGSAQVTRHGRTLATLHRGDHFGEIAIVGFRPQPATVTAVEPSVLFTLGRRYLLTLTDGDPSIQRRLFPQADDFREFARRLRDDGRKEWERLRPRYAARPALGRATVPGRELTWKEAVATLVHRPVGEEAGRAPAEPSARSTRFVWLAAAIAASVVAGFAAFYHPPVAVITPGRAVDISRDISITGTRVYQPTGRYLLTPVDIGRPRLAGLVWARALRRTIARTRSLPSDPAAVAREGHEAFVNSHRQAIALAERTLGVRPNGVTIAIRDRGFFGPSAGLVYALAILDMLGRGDLASHRVIAATGELEPNGSVGPVGLVSLKARAAIDAKALLFLVPRSQVSDVKGIRVVGVASLLDAMRALQRR
jgi:PDZ domain-containing protein